MHDPSRTNKKLLEEISALKQKIKELEQSESVSKLPDEEDLRAINEGFSLTEADPKLLKSIIEKSSEAIAISNSKGHLIYINPAHEKLFGHSLAEALRLNYRDYYPPDSIEILNNEVAPALERGESWEGTLYSFDATGRKFPLWERADSISDASGKMKYGFGFMHDSTKLMQAEEARRQLEERLSRSEKMESLGTLAGGVAHDLNNVLGIVVGYSELLLDKIEESSPVRSYATTIMDASDRAAAIIQDMLTLARRGVQDRAVVNLNTLVTDFLRMPEFLHITELHPDIKINSNLPAEVLPMMGSLSQLGKAITNLVSNAVEAMPQGGVLTITTSMYYLDSPVHGYEEVREGDYIVLSVSDTGGGISAKDIKQIFEPFYTKKVMGKSGTGLGLAVVWGTVKDHNGYIDVLSEEGKGSTFTLYFPVTREEIKTEEIEASISEYMGNGETILVVDDVEGQREMAAEMLRGLNYNVTVASSGEEAVAYLKEHKVDLIVLDMIMDPGMDGLDTYQSIIEIHPGQKAIIVSGFSETDRSRGAQKLGAGAYVKKPYIKEKIRVAIRDELARK